MTNDPTPPLISYFVLFLAFYQCFGIFKVVVVVEYFYMSALSERSFKITVVVDIFYIMIIIINCQYSHYFSTCVDMFCGIFLCSIFIVCAMVPSMYMVLHKVIKISYFDKLSMAVVQPAL